MFCLWGLILKPTERAHVLLKNSDRDFEDSPPFERLPIFYVTITGNFEYFQYSNFAQIFWKMKTFIKKLQNCFAFESIIIESVTFPYKTAISEANVKINRIRVFNSVENMEIALQNLLGRGLVLIHGGRMGA